MVSREPVQTGISRLGSNLGDSFSISGSARVDLPASSVHPLIALANASRLSLEFLIEYYFMVFGRTRRQHPSQSSSVSLFPVSPY
jgi:hypothetical protein